AALDASHLRVQGQVIRMALLRHGSLTHARAAGCDDPYVRAALEIARRLQLAAFESPAGHPNWIGAYRTQDSRARTLRPLRWDLYGGRAGVALFLAAAGAMGDDDARALALRVVDPLMRDLWGGRHPVAASGLGLTALGGTISPL